MHTKQIIENAERLSDELSQADVQSRERGVDEGYINQLLSYLIQQQIKDSATAIKKLKTLLDKMPSSGFAKRQFGRRKNHFDKAKQILTDFKVQRPLFELSLKELLQILGWTVKLMKYKKGGN